jgi:hypothetical protein
MFYQVFYGSRSDRLSCRSHVYLFVPKQRVSALHVRMMAGIAVSLMLADAGPGRPREASDLRDAHPLLEGSIEGGAVGVVADDGERKGEREVREAWDGLRIDFPGVHMAAQEELTRLS